MQSVRSLWPRMGGRGGGLFEGRDVLPDRGGAFLADRLKLHVSMNGRPGNGSKEEVASQPHAGRLWEKENRLSITVSKCFCRKCTALGSPHATYGPNSTRRG